MNTNCSSPYEAIMTPMTIKATLPRVFRFTGETPKIHEAIRTATGVVALNCQLFGIIEAVEWVHTLSIWINDTLKYRYVRFPQINDKLNIKPIGTIARRYILPVIGTFFREFSTVVKRARI